MAALLRLSQIAIIGRTMAPERLGWIKIQIGEESIEKVPILVLLSKLDRFFAGQNANLVAGRSIQFRLETPR
jgi:hypothetical protein